LLSAIDSISTSFVISQLLAIRFFIQMHFVCKWEPNRVECCKNRPSMLLAEKWEVLSSQWNRTYWTKFNQLMSGWILAAAVVDHAWELAREAESAEAIPESDGLRKWFTWRYRSSCFHDRFLDISGIKKRKIWRKVYTDNSKRRIVCEERLSSSCSKGWCRNPRSLLFEEIEKPPTISTFVRQSDFLKIEISIKLLNLWATCLSSIRSKRQQIMQLDLRICCIT
jgi:hypothetical protein